jgi:hypothetical protein
MRKIFLLSIFILFGIVGYSQKIVSVSNPLEKILQNTVLPKKIIIVDQNYDNVSINYAIHTLNKYFYKNYIIIKNLKKIAVARQLFFCLKIITLQIEKLNLYLFRLCCKFVICASQR